MGRLQLRFASWSFVALFLVVIGLIMGLSRHYHWQFDWTKTGRNSLSSATLSLLKRLDQPITATAYVSGRSELREPTRELLARYERAQKNFHFELVNPDTDPTRARAAVQFDGEVVLEYGGKKENISQLNEENLTNALARLARAGERWIVFLSGHGERKPDGQANHDYGTWGAQLQKRGFKTRTLSLSENPQVPQNTGVLVVADPQIKLLPGEIKQIEAYLNQGGNMLWLSEPGSRGMEPIAENLGFEFLPGTVVDPNSQVLTGNDPSFVVVAKYGAQVVVRNLALMTLFPSTAALKLPPPSGARGGAEGTRNRWQGTVLLDTLPSAWTETGALHGKIQFDAGKDIRGPLTIGAAFTRAQEKREQRVAVIGDSDFVSNTFLGNGGNLDLAMNLLNWLSSDERYIDLPNRAASDASLNLSQRAQTFIAFGFFIVLPLFLLGTGIVIWWRRRRR